MAEASQTNQKPPRACKMLPAGTPAPVRAQHHRLKMHTKRQLRDAVEPGFFPVPNRRIDKAIQAETLRVMFTAQVSGGVMTPAAAEEQAIGTVARQLPAPERRRRLHFAPVRNDSAEYRKPYVRAFA